MSLEQEINKVSQKKIDFKLTKAFLKTAKFNDFSWKIMIFAENRARLQKNHAIYVVKSAKISEITQKVICA